MRTEIVSYSVKNSRIKIHPFPAVNGFEDPLEAEKLTEPTYECKPHKHEECEMALIFNGKICYYINDIEYVLLPGDIIFINSSVPHSTLGYNHCDLTIQAENMFLDEDMGKSLNRIIASMEKDVAVFKADTHVAKQLTECFHTIIQETSKKENAYDLFIRTEMCKVFALLYREGVLVLSKDVLGEKGVDRLLPVLDYVDTHYKEDISLERASGLLNINKTHFCRIFKKSIGMTFVRYLNLVKVTKAEEFLLTTDRSVAEIAEEVGFVSSAYFTKIFKQHLHISPRRYRNIKADTNDSKNEQSFKFVL